MEIYLSIVRRYAAVIITLLLGVTVYFVLQLPRLTTDSNPYLLPEEHPARSTILEMQKEFTGTFDAVMIGLHNKDSVFNSRTLAALHHFTSQARRLMLAAPEDERLLAELTNKHQEQSEFRRLAASVLEAGLQQNDYFAAVKLLDALKGVEISASERSFLTYLPRRLNPVKELAGMAASENILMKDETLVIRTSLDSPATDPARVESEVMGNEMMVNSVVSRDGTTALLAVELFIAQNDAEGQLRAYEAIKAFVNDYRKANPEFKDDVHIAGTPIFIAETKKLIDRDMGTLFPIVVVIVTGLLIYFFRKPMGVILPMLNVLMCAAWTLGLMAELGVPLDLMTSVLPVFLITICGADAVHLMSEYYAQRSLGLPKDAAVGATMRAIVSPVVLTTITTVGGFLVSTSTNLSSIRSFGIFMAVGLVAAQIISLALIPAWITLFGAAEHRKPGTDGREGRIGSVLQNLVRPLLQRRMLALGIFCLATIAAAVLASRVHVEDAGAEYFSERNRFRQSDDFINAHVAGTSPGWISFEGSGPRAVIRQEVVEFLGRLDEFLTSRPNVTYTYSLATYVKRMYYVMNEMDPAFNRLPATTELIGTGADAERISGDEIVSQAVLMYENGGGSDLTNVLNRDFSKSVTLFTMNTTRASEYKALLNSLHDWLRVNTPADLKVSIGGTPVIWSGVLDELLKGQIKSFVLALLSVCVVLMLWLRSFRLGILTTLPLAATLVFYYASMSLLGIDLNIGTALISFMVVGIVDYSAHFLHGIRQRLEIGETVDDGILYSIEHSGKSILLNVLMFSLGFMALLFSDFAPIVHLGSLVALALALSGFMSIFLISVLGPVFIPLPGKGTRESEAAVSEPLHA